MNRMILISTVEILGAQAQASTDALWVHVDFVNVELRKDALFHEAMQ